jgi:hypothetical protein
MAGKSTRSGRHDLRCIQIDEPEEVQYWMMVFSCGRQELLEAVETVGPAPVDVGAYLADERASKDDNSFSWH